jgi:hypothetical protein
MFDFKSNLKIPISRNTLYCVWIRERGGENAPLVRVWIDPSMAPFASRADADACAVAATPTGDLQTDDNGEGDGPGPLHFYRQFISFTARSMFYFPPVGPGSPVAVLSQ